jgi:hypothetical protein
VAAGSDDRNPRLSDFVSLNLDGDAVVIPALERRISHPAQLGADLLAAETFGNSPCMNKWRRAVPSLRWTFSAQIVRLFHVGPLQRQNSSTDEQRGATEKRKSSAIRRSFAATLGGWGAEGTPPSTLTHGRFDFVPRGKSNFGCCKRICLADNSVISH